MVTKEKGKGLSVQLSWVQIWGAGTVIAGLLGTMYAAGIKTETEVKKVELLKQEQKFQDQLSEVNVKLRGVTSDYIFYKTEYSKSQARLTNCLKKESFLQALGVTDGDTE